MGTEEGSNERQASECTGELTASQKEIHENCVPSPLAMYDPQLGIRSSPHRRTQTSRIPQRACKMQNVQISLYKTVANLIITFYVCQATMALA